ncbi:hypothetical protein [Streptomyces termitum]|uniref:hypothetical protein n=1 Tax=Streptomyces termitum TaxID=67368 RepID=UPI0033AEB73A
MTEATDQDVSKKISSLREYLEKADESTLTTTGWMNKQLAPVNKLIEELKEEQKKVAEEVTKAPWEEAMEQVGLGGFAEIIKKGLEDGLMASAKTIGLALLGLLVPVLLGSLGAFLVQKAQRWHSDRTGSTFGLDPSGVIRRQTFEEIQAQQNGGGGNLLDQLPANADFDHLRGQLAALNPELLKFNNRAPSFLQSFRRLPREGAATKAANGVRKIAEAVAGVNHAEMRPVADGVNRINNVMRNADARKVGKVAQATDRLRRAMTGFEPSRIPSGPTLQASADAMGNLARESGTLRSRFQELSRSVRSLDDAIGAATTA